MIYIYIYDMIYYIIMIGEIPECWKEATVISIPKPDQDSQNPSNYHTISLRAVYTKTMERMTNTRSV